MNLLISNGVSSSPATINDVAEGEVAIFNLDSGAQVTDISALSADVTLQVVEGTAVGKPSITSKIFKAGDIVLTSKKDFAAESVQTTFIGFNGSNTNLSIPEVSFGTYAIKLVDLTQGWEPFPRVNYEVRAAAVPSQGDVALALVKQINDNDDTKVNPELNNKHFVYAEAFINQASVALVDGAAGAVTIDAVQGQTVVHATVGSGQSIADLVAGDFIRIGATTGVDAGVYEVAAVEAGGGSKTSLAITLNTKYGGATVSGADSGRIAAGGFGASVASGIKLIAKKAETSFQTGVLEDFEGAFITPTTTPNRGHGNPAQIAELERRSFPVRSYYETNYFPQTPESRVVASKGYDLVTLKIKNDNDRAVLRENETSILHIAIQEDGANAAAISGWF